MQKRKKIIVLFCAVLVIMTLVLAAIPLLSYLTKEPEPSYNFIFADPSLSADIYADEDYLNLDRSIYYATGMGGYEFVSEILEKTDYSKSVQKLIAFVEAAIAGDAQAYNACFSPEYLAASGPVAPFTMQKLYDICITEYIASSTAVVPDGYEDIEIFGLSYKIKDNNGSLRRDIGSDCSREQYITLVTDKYNNIFIYGIETRHTRPAK